MRCFVAVDLASDLVSKVTRVQEDLAGLDLKTAVPENMHFTLKFLGEADVKVLDEVSAHLKKVASQTKPFDITIETLGVFPSEKLVRVIWIGAPDLMNLHVQTDAALAGLFKKEKPVPHLTIARVRSQDKRLADFLDKNRGVHIGRMRVDRIKLKKSTVTWQGPVYEDIEVFELEGK